MPEAPIMPEDGRARSPLMLLEPLAVCEVAITPTLHHVEVYTLKGLLTLLWHGPRDTSRVVITCGGGMGSLLGPAGAIYHDLGSRFASAGIATIRVGYRRPNHLPYCVHDLAAAADLAVQGGAEAVVTVGHSFGGAVAIQAAIAFGALARGVVTLSTQSAGCEDAARLGATPLLLCHGDRDEILPAQTSEVVRALAGQGELVILPGAGHLLDEAHDELRELLGRWIPERLGG
jgi:pimeloyl-ACP methyl ester carboxylesterase